MEKKDFGRVLLKEYGISEWEEKCMLLSNSEAVSVLDALRNGEYNLLVELVKLPYPQFANEYVKLYRNSLMRRRDKLSVLHDYLMQDSPEYADLGYKLYVMQPHLVKMVVDYLKCPEKSIYAVCGTNRQDLNYNDLIMFLNQPLEEVYKLRFSKQQNKDAIKKYIHVMSYIDAKEAEKLGLDSFTYKRFGEYRGFDIEEKLNALNALIRHIVMENLGFNGSYEKVYELAATLNVPDSLISQLLTDEFYVAFTKSAGEFKNYIKLLDRNYEPDERRAYAIKSPFKKVCDRIELNFVSNYLKENGDIIQSEQLKRRYSESYIDNKFYALVDKSISEFDGDNKQL